MSFKLTNILVDRQVYACNDKLAPTRYALVLPHHIEREGFGYKNYFEARKVVFR